MSSKNYIDVIIDGKIYNIGGFESEAYLQKVASYINNMIAEFKQNENYRVQKVDMQRILLEINIANDYFKGDGKTGGVEVYIYSNTSKAKKDAEQVCKNISKALGITNRGVKVNTSLYVLRKTKSPAMLIECCFVDDKDDAKKWNAAKCAEAIAKALV